MSSSEPSSTSRPTTRTASACAAAEAARATHAFKVIGKTLHSGFGVGNSVDSAAFDAGGHRWCIQYYPDGGGDEEGSDDHVTIYLTLLSGDDDDDADATVKYDFCLVDQATGLLSPSPVYSHQAVFNTHIASTRGFTMTKTDLHAMGYLKDDCLDIECDVTVIKRDDVLDVDAPPHDLPGDLGKLLEDYKLGVDVTFSVKEEDIHAHRIVLAMRSKVFKAELYGPLSSDKRNQSIVVEDMEPLVFKALIRFIYTDSLPAMDDLDAGEYEAMVKHLLVAADRYGMERMKLMCESILCGWLSVDRVASTLVLADQHHCSQLQDACVRFINVSNRMDDVAASEGYQHLKRACQTPQALG
ncbi:hypothetical protein HU200_041698 [Digitaria exilis]|uniref:Uncharacterized protein n=1 Tax=Digitaria exilis TaxID=1010633 RepID=A0A835EDJ4_9POAL|nr:hypothetical protein HU200_041698 [Digitaria exilis]CAB3480457.1 unnamed protein product [Digitaria exilis]